MTRLARARWLEVWTEPSREQAWAEHRRILGHVRRNEPDEAAREAAEHVRDTRDRLVRSLNEDRRFLRAQRLRGDRPMTPEPQAPAASPDDDHWFVNLIVCTFGSFTTIVAMTLLLPFLPLYVEELGVSDHAAIVQWSGVAYGAAFFTAALTAPLWGRLGDLYGRKLMLIRASLGMAIAMSLIGMAQNVYQLVGSRLLTGLLGGYASGSMILVAAQTPGARRAGRSASMSSGVMAGNLAGPLIGGVLPPLIGIRLTFLRRARSSS